MVRPATTGVASGAFVISRSDATVTSDCEVAVLLAVMGSLAPSSTEAVLVTVVSIAVSTTTGRTTSSDWPAARVPSPLVKVTVGEAEQSQPVPAGTVQVTPAGRVSVMVGPTAPASYPLGPLLVTTMV